jgi:recombinational DNA repair protein RecR
MFTSSEKKQGKEALEKALEIIESMPEKKTCRTCVHFTEDEACALAGEIVPDHIIEKGCELYSWDGFSDEVPF